jgi:tetrahydrodipicolinate N-succinyltransferase
LQTENMDLHLVIDNTGKAENLVDRKRPVNVRIRKTSATRNGAHVAR